MKASNGITASAALVLAMCLAASSAIAARGTQERWLQGIRIAVPKGLKVTEDRSGLRVQLQEKGATVGIAYAGWFSSDANYPIGGRDVDGDSPNAILDAVASEAQKSLGERARSRVSRTRKSKVKDGTVYYASIDYVAESGGGADPAVRGRMFHILFKAKSSGRIDHVVVTMEPRDSKTANEIVRCVLKRLGKA